MLTWTVKEDGDIEIDGAGRPLTVTGKDKLRQLIKELLLIQTDDRGFGTSLGRSGFDVVTEIYEALSAMLSMQNKSQYARTVTEQLGRITDLSLVSEQEKTGVRFRLVVENKAAEDVVVEV